MTIRLRLLIISALLLVHAVTGSRAGPRADYTYDRIVTEIIIPGFRHLGIAAKDHVKAWKAYCAAPSAERLAGLTETFGAVADRWAEIEMIRSGPASDGFRRDRFYFWPERKNAVQRGLAALMASPDSATLTADRIAAESAAVQGLPALERLIYAEGTVRTDLGLGEDGPVRCRLGEAISENAARLANEMLGGWQAMADVMTPETQAALATDLVTAYSFLKDIKIEGVIGKSADDVKPRAAEFWRSGRPMRNIILNLEALDRVNPILFELMSLAKEDVLLPVKTRAALDIARTMPPDLAQAAAGKDRSEAILLRDAVDVAADGAIAEIPAALGATVGFNSLDGD